MKIIEEKRQAALSKKRKREEMEAQRREIEQMNELNNAEEMPLEEDVYSGPVRVEDFMNSDKEPNAKRGQAQFERRGEQPEEDDLVDDAMLEELGEMFIDDEVDDNIDLGAQS